ncbi:MAG TPA: AlpA family phage regulatory protein [Povalibacter sp.]|uniref:helix-turn-helix transcriptional regulator n=1 Tax=Povalibacter sp. TaxID=1962978 RepID=UPI002B7C65B1|nr:AlpA family phage regulatory protein [Povalibacter sp.]HMN42932.1 AlpA family phage regulatory protein [Povalibacter sp.]
MSRILRRREICAMTTLSKTTLYARIKEGSFPKAIQLGPKAVGWREDEVLAWMTGQPRKGEPPAGSASPIDATPPTAPAPTAITAADCCRTQTADSSDPSEPADEAELLADLGLTEDLPDAEYFAKASQIVESCQQDVAAINARVAEHYARERDALRQRLRESEERLSRIEFAQSEKQRQWYSLIEGAVGSDVGRWLQLVQALLEAGDTRSAMAVYIDPPPSIRRALESSAAGNQVPPDMLTEPLFSAG